MDSCLKNYKLELYSGLPCHNFQFMKIPSPEQDKNPSVKKTSLSQGKTMQAPPFALQYSLASFSGPQAQDAPIQRQAKPKSSPKSPVEFEIEALEFWSKVAQNQYQTLLADSAELRASIPHKLKPGTQAYADAKNDLEAQLLFFAKNLGTYYGKAGAGVDANHSPELTARYKAILAELQDLINWVGLEAYNQVIGGLPRADVINVHTGPNVLPRPEGGITFVGREGQQCNDGVLTRDYLLSQGYVEKPAMSGPLVNVPPEKQQRIWNHPKTGAQVILLPK